MPVDEAMRHQIFKGFEKLYGPEQAAAMMEMFPRVDWEHVALKSDLLELEQRLDARFQVIAAQFEALEHKLGEKIEKSTQSNLRWTLGTVGVFMLATIGTIIGLLNPLLSRIPTG